MRTTVISTVERRRRWSAEDKARILDEASRPGANLAAIADDHGVCRSLLYRWRKLAQEGALRGVSLRRGAPQGFAPVRIAPPDGTPTCSSPAPQGAGLALAPQPHRRMALIEIALNNGRVVRVEESVEADALARIVAALDRPC
jgi:transposase